MNRVFFQSIVFVALFFGVFTGCKKNIRIRPETGNDPAISNWTHFGGGQTRTNFLDEELNPPLHNIWTYKASSAIGTSIVVAEGIVFYSTLDGRVEAIEISSGKRIGKVKIEEGIEATCTYHNKNLYIAQRYGDKTLIKMDLQTGKYLWKINAGDIASEPLVTDEGVYISALYHHIDKYDPETGIRLWTYKTEDQHRSSPAFRNNIVISGCDNGDIYALNAEKGDLKWKIEVGASVFATPVISGETVYVGSIDSVLYALSLSDGSIKWKYKIDYPIFQTAATNSESLIFGDSNGSLYCLNNDSGELKWKFSAQSSISTSPAISGDVVYFGSLDQNYYCLDVDNGKKIWEFKTQGRIRTSPAIWDKYLIGASEDKYLFCFEKKEPIAAY